MASSPYWVLGFCLSWTLFLKCIFFCGDAETLRFESYGCLLRILGLQSTKLIDSYSARRYTSAQYWIHFTARFGGVDAFGYNSAESEPIWMKSGTSEYIVWDWLWQILGTIGAVASTGTTAGEPCEIFDRLATHDITDFSSAKFHEI